MIYNKDAENGKAFWSAVTGDRVILPNGMETERIAYDPTGWWLLNVDNEYWLYTAEEIGSITCTSGYRMTVYPVGKPCAICDKSEYEYELEDGAIVIKERDQEADREARCIGFAETANSVSHPSHYADGWSNGAEVIDLTEHLSFCAGNVVKYVCRAGRKDPDKYVEDLEKARWYLDREIARVKGTDAVPVN